MQPELQRLVTGVICNPIARVLKGGCLVAIFPCLLIRLHEHKSLSRNLPKAVQCSRQPHSPAINARRQALSRAITQPVNQHRNQSYKARRGSCRAKICMRKSTASRDTCHHCHCSDLMKKRISSEIVIQIKVECLLD